MESAPRRGRSWRLVVGLVLVAQPASPSNADWPQWGGPDRNFTVETRGLAETWPRGGPKRLWRRELGDGYSGIVHADGVLYTLYRSDPLSNEERVVALDAATGRTLWERTNPAPLSVRPDERWSGVGPNATPLIVGPRLFTVGSNALLQCFDKASGEVSWSRDLVAEYGAPYPNSGEMGFASSPIAFESLIIVPVGGRDSADSPRGQSLVAFDQSDGKEVWKSLDFGPEAGSPILVRLGERSQLVFASKRAFGVDPATGAVLWSIDLGPYGPIPSPVFDGRDRLFFSARGERAENTAVRLVPRGDTTDLEVLWKARKPIVGVATPVAVGDDLFGATDVGLFGLDLATGEVAWVERGFPNASCVHADGKLIILDHTGKLSLATATREGLTVHARATVTEKYSFTVPTLVGRTLYVRDRKHILALDLGPATQTEAERQLRSKGPIRVVLVALGLVVAVGAWVWWHGHRAG